MKKIVLWGMSTLTVLVLLFGYHTSTSSTSAAAVRGGNASLASPVQGGTDSNSGASSDTFSTSGGSSSSASSSAAAAPSSAAAPTTPSTPTTAKVTGTVAATRWGPVQIQLSLANKKITQVSVLQYPTGTRRDQEINSYALPQLIQETLKAQSSDIDMVSGATVTSDGYLQSLQSALDKAGI